MPALFAYLITVGLLLGGGYGALSWLAAPEPAKVVAKAKPKPLPQASSEAMSFGTSSLAIKDSDPVASGSIDSPLSSQSETRVAASEQGAGTQSSGPSQAQQSRVADAEVSPAEAKQEVRQPAIAVSPASANNAQPAVSLVPTTAARPVKRPHSRQAGNRSEKSALTLMILRTIEFPDGRRLTKLIPYRNGERALAFEPGE
jgi:hypothetical protein